MFRTTNLFILGCLIIFGACTEAGEAENQDQKTGQKPNVILVITDDQGYGDLGCHGNSIIQTPNLDALHKESVRFTDFHVSPTCAPTRSALMTGRYTNRTGAWHTIAGWSSLRKEEKTLANMFTEGGYVTGAFGKWHLGDNYPFRPYERGFQHTVMHGGGGVQQTPDYWGNDYFDDIYFKNGKPQQYQGYCTDVFFEEAMRFIEKEQDKPFFCYIATNAPHGPFNVPVADLAKYDGIGPDELQDVQKRFYAMITNIDDNFGKLRAKLNELNIADNTILIFMSDNGTAAGYRTNKDNNTITGFNAGMRGTKGSQYDGGHRVPFFVYWKDGEIHGGKDITELAAHVDVMPTLAEWCGIALPKDHLALDGKSLTPLLEEGQTEWADRMLITDSQRIQVPRKWKSSAVMSNQWRLVDGKELYDMKADPGQEQDVAAQYPEQVEKMKTFYDQWWESVSVQFDQEINIPVGNEAENPVTLTTHDWHADNGAQAWNQIAIRQGRGDNGYWSIEVESEGDYEISLRRYPVESGLAINATTPGLTTTDLPGLQNDIPAGENLNFSSGMINIGGKIHQVKPVEDGADAVNFNVNLEAGPTILTATFKQPDKEELGAYYVYVRKL